MPAVPAMYVSKQLVSLLPGDAPQRNVVWPLSIELAVWNAACSGLASHALGILFLLRQGPLKQVHLELLGPAPLLRLEREEQADP